MQPDRRRIAGTAAPRTPAPRAAGADGARRLRTVRPVDRLARPTASGRRSSRTTTSSSAPRAKPEEIRLSTDGKAGLAYGRLSWSPDSKTLVAFRIEPGERKEVYLIQSSPPGGGRAKLRTRPYPLPGDKFTAYELNLFDVASQEGDQARGRSDRLRVAAAPLGQGRPSLHL